MPTAVFCPLWCAQVLSKVYLPLMQQAATGTQDAAGAGLHAAVACMAAERSRELLGSVQKYLAHIQTVQQQLNGDVVLQLPAPAALDSVLAGCRDADAVHACEEALAEWTATLSDVLQRESEKQPAGRGPLGELEHWRGRAAVLSGLWEQLSGRPGVTVLQAVEVSSDDRNLVAAFKAQTMELGKLVQEVRTCLPAPYNSYNLPQPLCGGWHRHAMYSAARCLRIR
jgi:Dynein heavy chain, N-terminal region 1